MIAQDFRSATFSLLTNKYTRETFVSKAREHQDLDEFLYILTSLTTSSYYSALLYASISHGTIHL